MKRKYADNGHVNMRNLNREKLILTIDVRATAVRLLPAKRVDLRAERGSIVSSQNTS